MHRSGRELRLGPTEFRLLEFLMSSPGRVFSREQLLDGVWGREIYVDERTVDVHVGRLRKAINRGRERDPIRTVRGSGYSFDERYVGGLSYPAGAHGAPFAPPLGQRLIGDARVIGAIGQALLVLAAAIDEVGRPGIADRPAAGRLGELQDRDPRPHRHDVGERIEVVFGVRAVIQLQGCVARGIGALGAFRWRRAACAGAAEALEGLLARPERPRRCTLPITALRVTPPSCPATWLAESPSCQSFLRSSTRSSVQLMVSPLHRLRDKPLTDQLNPSPYAGIEAQPVPVNEPLTLPGRVSAATRYRGNRHKTYNMQ